MQRGLGVTDQIGAEQAEFRFGGPNDPALVLDPVLFAVALGLATLTGLVAAYAPALRAARLDPVEAIHG